MKSDDFKTSEIPERRGVREMIPHLPQMQETQLDEEETVGNEDSKLKPVNVNALKEYMIKKVNKMAASNDAPPLEKKVRARRRHEMRRQIDQYNPSNVRNERSESHEHRPSGMHGSVAMPPKEPKSKGFGGRKSQVKSIISPRKENHA